MRLIPIGIVVLILAGCSEKDLRQAYEIVSASAEEVPLTNSEVVAALKDSLSRGISKGANIASVKDGYYGNPRLKIEFPTEVRKVEEALRKIGFGIQTDFHKSDHLDDHSGCF
jgi:RNA binding exosome subunit